MNVKLIAAVLAAAVTVVIGAPPTTAGTAATSPIKLAGTKARLAETAGQPARLASYALIFDAGQQYDGYLRAGDRFVKTAYREALVAPGERWAVGIPDSRLWLAQKKIDLIDRRSGTKHRITLPAPVTSPQWSPDGRTVLFTAQRTHRDGSLTATGFITLNVTDRKPRLVKAGPRPRLRDWSIGRDFRFYFTGRADGVMAMHDAKRIAVYDLDGTRRRLYTGIGVLDGWHTVTPFSPSGRYFATFVRKGEDGGQVGIVEASTGKVVHRIGGDVTAIAGWYDDQHVILSWLRPLRQVYRQVHVSGTVVRDLITEKLVRGPADYLPHLARVDFVRPAR